MFLVRSLRVQGAMIEVVQNGKIVNVSILGMGSTTSDKVTDDMVTQERFGFVRYQVKQEPAPEPMFQSDEELASLLRQAKEHLATLEKIPILYTEAELLSMRRADLKMLAAKKHVDLESGLNKDQIVDFLLAAKVTKE